MDLKKIEQQVTRYTPFLQHNAETLEIFEGALEARVKEVMKKTLSQNYYDTIKERIVPINVLTRIIEKLSKVYAYPVVRKSPTHQEWVDRMVAATDLDLTMLSAEEIANLHKGYLLEPYLDNKKKPAVRVLPFDRFIPIGLDPKDPTKMTAVVKFMGTVRINGKDEALYHYWDSSVFLPFTEKGVYSEDVIMIDGQPSFENPIGRIPFIYGNRAKHRLVPLPDTDMLQLAKMIPILLSDMGGALMYQCFTIIYGINVKSANLVMSPNAFWDIQGDPKAESAPSVGTIKPEADVDKMLSYVSNIFSLWLETKGIRVGSMGNLDASNLASGISKVIDEMDTTEARKKSAKFLKREEMDLWSLLVDMNNYWIQSDPDYTEDTIDPEQFTLSIEYTQPRPSVGRKEEVEVAELEYRAGFIDEEALVERLYPDLEGEEFEKRVVYMRSRNAKGNSNEQPQA
jgi:hypothetical protein